MLRGVEKRYIQCKCNPFTIYEEKQESVVSLEDLKTGVAVSEKA